MNVPDEKRGQEFVSEKSQMYAEIFAFFLSRMEPEDVEQMARKLRGDTEHIATPAAHSGK